MIDETQVEKVREQTRALTAQIDRRIVGHDGLVRGVLACLFAGGHVLLEGPPGTAKTFLAQCFANALGRTPAAEIRRARLEKVRRLLIETDLPLSAIAERTGHPHVEVMVRAFQRQYGLPPGKFRQER